MAHEILSVKLCQLEERLAGLHSRIRMSETADHSSLSREIGVLKSERSAANAAMRENLERSRSCVATILGRGYSQVEQVVLDSRRQLEELARSSRMRKPPSRKKYYWPNMRWTSHIRRRTKPCCFR